MTSSSTIAWGQMSSSAWQTLHAVKPINPLLRPLVDRKRSGLRAGCEGSVCGCCEILNSLVCRFVSRAGTNVNTTVKLFSNGSNEISICWPDTKQVSH